MKPTLSFGFLSLISGLILIVWPFLISPLVALILNIPPSKSVSVSQLIGPIACMIIAGVSAIISFMFERQNRGAFIFAIIGLLLAFSPFIILVLMVV